MTNRRSAFQFDRLVYLALDPAAQRDFYTIVLGAVDCLSFEPARAAPDPTGAGLFHTAFLYPRRSDLATALLRLESLGVAVHGASDHDVSEAIYFEDPEGNGIEIYADRPESDWKYDDGALRMGTHRLDITDLINTATPGARQSAQETISRPGAARAAFGSADWSADLESRASALDDALAVSTPPVVGHVHLRALDLQIAENFWAGEAMLDVTARYHGVASFLSKGGYHHHIGVNRFSAWTARVPGAPGLARIEARGGSGRDLVTPEGLSVELASA